MKKIIHICIVLILSGCAYKAKLTNRYSGDVHFGYVKSNESDPGTMTIQIDGRSCAGPFVKAESGDSFGFAQTYGRHGAISFASIRSPGASSTYKALLSCSDNTVLRCDIDGLRTGEGICVDSHNRVYDMVF